jgi:hypothetical protein
MLSADRDDPGPFTRALMITRGLSSERDQRAEQEARHFDRTGRWPM